MAMKFYKCSVCGNIVYKVIDSDMPLTCCGRQMVELRAGMTDGASEKHVPVYSEEGGIVMVKVGAEDHPMTDMHHIEFIAIETDKGVQIRFMGKMIDNRRCFEGCGEKCPDECKAECCFKLCEGENLLNIYSYCNLHGMYVVNC